MTTWLPFAKLSAEETNSIYRCCQATFKLSSGSSIAMKDPGTACAINLAPVEIKFCSPELRLVSSNQGVGLAPLLRKSIYGPARSRSRRALSKAPCKSANSAHSTSESSFNGGLTNWERFEPNEEMIG